MFDPIKVQCDVLKKNLTSRTKKENRYWIDRNNANYDCIGDNYHFYAFPKNIIALNNNVFAQVASVADYLISNTEPGVEQIEEFRVVTRKRERKKEQKLYYLKSRHYEVFVDAKYIDTYTTVGSYSNVYAIKNHMCFIYDNEYNTTLIGACCAVAVSAEEKERLLSE